MGIVYLSGPSGSGKTYLAAAILAEVLAAGLYPPQAVRFIGERTYLDDLKASFNQGDPELRPRLLPPNHIQRLPLLFFDDLATSRLTDWAKGEIAGLIEGRHAEDLATVITSNLSLDELARQVDSRLASRIGENGAVLQFPARDLRICGRLKAPRWTPTGRGGPGRRAPVDDAAAPLADPPARGPLSAVAPGEAEPGNAADLAGGQSFGPSASRPRAGAKKNLGKILTNRQPVE
jgi:hypothetical protein